MLFLAVFCGFLAEYQLQHKIEKEKGKQYIASFYRDLVTDTTFVNQVIEGYETKLAVLITLPECFDTLDIDISSEHCLRKLVSQSYFFPELLYTDRTMQQLKNAGGLRLLKSADADSILKYDNLIQAYQSGERSAMQKSQDEIRRILTLLINYKRINGKCANKSVRFLYGDNRQLLNQYFNELSI